jgi:hypothetical protein
MRSLLSYPRDFKYALYAYLIFTVFLVFMVRGYL